MPYVIATLFSGEVRRQENIQVFSTQINLLVNQRKALLYLYHQTKAP